jgi:hypothetical protein
MQADQLEVHCRPAGEEKGALLSVDTEPLRAAPEAHAGDLDLEVGIGADRAGRSGLIVTLAASARPSSAPVVPGPARLTRSVGIGLSKGNDHLACGCIIEAVGLPAGVLHDGGTGSALTV